MTKDRDWISELVIAAKQSFADGINDPSAEQLAQRYYGTDKIIPQAIIDDIRRRLNRVRRLLEEDGHITAPLAETYYREPPGPITSRTAAIMCLATGNAKRTAGILRSTGDPDTTLIWQEWEALNAKRAAGASAKGMDRLRHEFDKGHVDVGEIASTLAPAQAIIEPAISSIAQLPQKTRKVAK